MSTEPAPKRPTRKGLLFAALYGMAVATIGYLVGRGNPFWMLIVMITIGIAFRLHAYLLIRRRGDRRPPWWRWL